MGKANHLGDYLKARRARVTAAEVGLVPGPRRRVAGLRRDELAMLAGISSEYLQRLEQGRDRHPSAEVLDSIARALRMDAKATTHLHQLAGSASRPRHVAPENVSAEIAGIIGGAFPQEPDGHGGRVVPVGKQLLGRGIYKSQRGIFCPTSYPGDNERAIRFAASTSRYRFTTTAGTRNSSISSATAADTCSCAVRLGREAERAS